MIRRAGWLKIRRSRDIIIFPLADVSVFPVNGSFFSFFFDLFSFIHLCLDCALHHREGSKICVPMRAYSSAPLTLFITFRFPSFIYCILCVCKYYISLAGSRPSSSVRVSLSLDLSCTPILIPPLSLSLPRPSARVVKKNLADLSTPSHPILAPLSSTSSEYTNFSPSLCFFSTKLYSATREDFLERGQVAKRKRRAKKIIIGSRVKRKRVINISRSECDVARYRPIDRSIAR